jgi:hypothetical protein
MFHPQGAIQNVFWIMFLCMASPSSVIAQEQSLGAGLSLGDSAILGNVYRDLGIQAPSNNQATINPPSGNFTWVPNNNNQATINPPVGNPTWPTWIMPRATVSTVQTPPAECENLADAQLVSNATSNQLYQLNEMCTIAGKSSYSLCRCLP